jgi:hypothetical protein
MLLGVGSDSRMELHSSMVAVLVLVLIWYFQCELVVVDQLWEP